MKVIEVEIPKGVSMMQALVDAIPPVLTEDTMVVPIGDDYPDTHVMHESRITIKDSST